MGTWELSFSLFLSTYLYINLFHQSIACSGELPTEPSARNRPRRGPRIAQPTRAAVPPVKCTTPEPAKSMAPLPNRRCPFCLCSACQKRSLSAEIQIHEEAKVTFVIRHLEAAKCLTGAIEYYYEIYQI